MEIVTGKVGTPHVSSADSRAMNAAIIGTGNYVLNVGSKFGATIETSNNIVIADGELVINGTHARIPHGDNDTVIIENGTTGYNRIDLIVARYKQTSGLESVELKVIKGETVAGTPTRPSYTSGNVLADAEIAEMPLYAVQLSGVNVASITPLFTIATGLDDVYRKNEVDAIKTALQTSINNAQSTANTGVTNAAAAQSTANTARQEVASHNHDSVYLKKSGIILATLGGSLTIPANGLAYRDVTIEGITKYNTMALGVQINGNQYELQPEDCEPNTVEISTNKIRVYFRNSGSSAYTTSLDLVKVVLLKYA